MPDWFPTAAPGSVDWVTISAFATGAGTLVLALATFASVRSANRAARVAERSLQVNLRPVLFPSRPQDPPLKVHWVDRRWSMIPGGRASVEFLDDVVYLALSLRNVGSGIAVILGWLPTGEWRPATSHADPEVFHPQTRDLYIPPGDTSFWQGAIRDLDDPRRAEMVAAVTRREPFTIDLLYGDHDGGQRTISRFGIIPIEDGDDVAWMSTVVLHWNLDRPDPR
ncbi:MAG: hypothetical protein ABSG81_05715 [Acidimicrobiales bacterium]|jgi:hypothetical protein